MTEDTLAFCAPPKKIMGVVLRGFFFVTGHSTGRCDVISAIAFGRSEKTAAGQVKNSRFPGRTMFQLEDSATGQEFQILRGIWYHRLVESIWPLQLLARRMINRRDHGP